MSSELQRSLRRLIPQPRTGRGGLDALGNQAAVPAGTGQGDAETGETDAGIASPLVERDASLREYYGSQRLKSADGLFVLDLRAIKSATFDDANGREVVLEFQPPPDLENV